MIRMLSWYKCNNISRFQPKLQLLCVFCNTDISYHWYMFQNYASTSCFRVISDEEQTAF